MSVMSDRALAAARLAHPEWGTLVSAVDSPDGGVWIVGADGGVFAVDQAGNPSGTTPYLGSYTGLNPEQRQGERSFVSITRNDSGGYDLLSRANERYSFAGQKPTEQSVSPPAPGAPAPTGVDAEEASLRATLQQAGLADLWEEAWTYHKTQAGGNPDVTFDWLRTTDAYKAKFPAMEWLRQNNQPIKNEADYLDYTQRVSAAMKSAGLPETFWDQPEDFATLLTNEWSVREVEEAVQMAATSALSMSAQTRSELQRLYNIGPGDLAAFWLNPDKATPMLERKAQAAIAGIAGQATDFGLTLSETEARTLLQSGLDAESARSRLADATQFEPLLAETVGEHTAKDELGRAERIGLLTGGAEGAEATRKLEQRRRSRQAQFEGGGGAAGLGRGTSGLG